MDPATQAAPDPCPACYPCLTMWVAQATSPTVRNFAGKVQKVGWAVDGGWAGGVWTAISCRCRVYGTRQEVQGGDAECGGLGGGCPVPFVIELSPGKRKGTWPGVCGGG